LDQIKLELFKQFILIKPRMILFLDQIIFALKVKTIAND